jgi:hypothetical protein
MATMQPPQPGGMAPKKTSPLVWILVGCGGLVVFCLLVFGILSVFVFHKAKQFGAEMKDNPGLAMTKMMATINPNAEVISSDDSKGTVTMKDKTTGKVTTLRFDKDTKKMVIIGDDGKEVEFSASGDGKDGKVEIKSPDGNMTIGSGGNKLPSWLPTYPGSSPTGNFSAQGPDGNTGTFSFKTKDASDKVLSYYQDAVKSAGLKVTASVNTSGDSGKGGMLAAESEDKKRVVTVTVGDEHGESSVAIMVNEKK